MNKVIIIPDSFKGSMNSSEICSIMEKSIKSKFPNCSILSIPIADGGEGTVDAFLAALGGEKISLRAIGPYFGEIDSFYGRLPDKTAVIEMAAAAGLPLAGEKKRVEKATTYGVGQLIGHALHLGCRKIILGLGGSATNDGGAGAAAALGITFRRKDGESFIPVGDTLREIDSIDASSLLPLLHHAEIIGMCDIQNPLCGENGAAAVFSPQKGANPNTVSLLDEGLLHLAQVIQRDLGRDILNLVGAGAAGGMGGGMVGLLGAHLQSGIETLLQITYFSEQLSDTDFIFTGEGRIDSQSLQGKVISGVAKYAKEAGVPLIAVVGDIDSGIDKIYDMGVTSVFSINQKALPFSEAKKSSKRDLADTMDNILRFYLSVQSVSKQ